jgi:hypothetical protein
MMNAKPSAIVSINQATEPTTPATTETMAAKPDPIEAKTPMKTYPISLPAFAQPLSCFVCSPVPPSYILQFFDSKVIKTFTNFLCRNSTND